MEPIDEAFVRKIDGELIKQDVRLHARPFQVVVALMRENQIAGDLLDKSTWGPLMAIYKKLYPRYTDPHDLLRQMWK